MVARNQEVTTGWIGWGYFAACLMIMIGFFQMIMGLAALVNDKFYVALEGRLLIFDFTTWGWIHLALGIVILMAGVSLFSGSLWSRVVAIVLASLNLLVQFSFVGVYPVWSVIVMVIDILVIYALAVHGSEMKSVE